jgi:serine/threonine protein phosphatase PrpC
MSFLTFGISVQCKGKEHVNQDRFGSVVVKSPSGRDVLTAAVSDGVTMCFKGEVASYNTIRFILNWSAEYFSENDFNLSIIPEEFDRLVSKINRSLNSYAKAANKKSPKSGYSPYSSCTLSCMITDGNHILFFNVGDSVIYELKTYSTVGITGTKKHINIGGKLTSYIGGIDDNKLDIRCFESIYDRSSAYLLCTDGMSGRIVFDTEASEDFRKFNQRLLSANTGSKGSTVLEGMVEYVISQGETDDITALVVKSN